MPKHVCIVTGPLVGLRSTWFIRDTIDFAKCVGEKIVVFNLLDEILRQEGLRTVNAYEMMTALGRIVNGYQYQFQYIREKAYLAIARRMDRLDKDTSVIVRTPASLKWRGLILEFKDHQMIAETLQPDRVVTLIDAEWKIERRLKTGYGQHALKMVAQQRDLTLEGILDWLGSEVSVSEDWAEWCTRLSGKNVRHIVLGVETPSYSQRSQYVRDVDGLAKLATIPDLPTFYASYSMTVASGEARQTINDLVWRLRQYGLVIDPASIELGSKVHPAHRDVVFAYTVCRDLRWDVQKVDIIAAFHPYTTAPPLSTGMMDELGHARAFRKERYLVLPSGADSPFTKDNYLPANHVFSDGNALFTFFEKRRRPPLKPRFAHFVDAFVQWSSRREGEHHKRRGEENEDRR